MDDSTATKANSFLQAEKKFKTDEHTADLSEKQIVEHSKQIFAILPELQQSASDANWAMSDYLRAVVATGIATELRTTRASDYKTSKSVLTDVNERKKAVSKERDSKKTEYKKRRQSYESTQEQILQVKLRLMKKEIDWTGAKADYHYACHNTQVATDHLATCEAALSEAKKRLKEAKDKSDGAQLALDKIASSMADMTNDIHTKNCELDATFNGLLDIVSQIQDSELTYLAVEQAAHHAQKDVARLEAETSALKKQVDAATQLEDKTSQKAKELWKKVKDYGSKSVKEIEKEQGARDELRKAEREVSRSERERNRAHLDFVLQSHRDEQGHRAIRAVDRAILVLMVFASGAGIALLIGWLRGWEATPLVITFAVALITTLISLIANRFGMSDRPWARWMQWTGKLWENGRSWLRR